MARLLILDEAKVIEIQEPLPDGDYEISIDEKRQMCYSPKDNAFYQYQEWPSNKEIQTRTKELTEMEDKEEAEKQFQEAKADWKERSKKVKYKILLDGKDFAETVKQMLEDHPTHKEYL